MAATLHAASGRPARRAGRSSRRARTTSPQTYTARPSAPERASSGWSSNHASASARRHGSRPATPSRDKTSHSDAGAGGTAGRSRRLGVGLVEIMRPAPRSRRGRPRSTPQRLAGRSRYRSRAGAPPCRIPHQPTGMFRVQLAAICHLCKRASQESPIRCPPRWAWIRELVRYLVVQLLALRPAAALRERLRVRVPVVPRAWSRPSRKRRRARKSIRPLSRPTVRPVLLGWRRPPG